MQLLKLADAETFRSVRVFRYSRARAILFTGAAATALAGLVVADRDGRFPPGPWIAGALALVMLLMRRFVLARFRPTNWLVRTCDSGLLVQFRSYLNYHFPAEDPTVVLIPFGAIRSARLVRDRTTVPDLSTRRSSSTRTLRLVELELGEDTAPLAKALADELARRAPVEPHWYGTSSTRYEHHPVRVTGPAFVQIEWSVVPGPERLLDALRPHATIAPPVTSTEDLTSLESLPRAEQDERLHALVERGETVSAVVLARRLYGYDLERARGYVDDLRRGTPPATGRATAR